MPALHPFLVHFPVALLTVAWLADLVAYLRGKKEGSIVGWWNTVAGTAGLLCAAGSGLLAKSTTGPLPALAAGALSDHEQLAFAASVAFLLLTAWRFSHRSRIPQDSARLFLVLSGLAVGLLWVTAHVGGTLVHEFGVGITGAPRP